MPKWSMARPMPEVRSLRIVSCAGPVASSSPNSPISKITEPGTSDCSAMIRSASPANEAE